MGQCKADTCWRQQGHDGVVGDMQQDSDKLTSNQKATPFQRPSAVACTFSCVSDSHMESALGSEVWVRAAPATASTRCCRSKPRTGNGEDSRFCGTLQHMAQMHKTAEIHVVLLVV